MAAKPPTRDIFNYQLYHADGADREALLAWKLLPGEQPEGGMRIPRDLRNNWIMMYESGNAESVLEEVYNFIPETETALKGTAGQWLEELDRQKKRSGGAMLPRSDRSVRQYHRNFLELITNPAYQEKNSIPEIMEAGLGRQIRAYVESRLSAGLHNELFEVLKNYLDDVDPKLFVRVVLLYRDFRTIQYEQSLKSSMELNLEDWAREVRNSIREVLDFLPKTGRDITSLYPEIKASGERQGVVSPIAWVYIKGTTETKRYELNPDLRDIAYAFGRKLAETGFGLVISSYRGVNAAVMTAYIQRSNYLKNPRKGFIKILAESDIPVMMKANPALDEDIEAADLVQNSDADDFANACVLIGMTGKMQYTTRSFLEKGKPVFPVYDAFSDEEADTLRRSITPYARTVFGNDVVLQAIEGPYKDAIDRVIDILQTRFAGQRKE